MNRRKKIKQILLTRDKKANAKSQNKNKSGYISKADRAALNEKALQDSAGNGTAERGTTGPGI